MSRLMSVWEWAIDFVKHYLILVWLVWYVFRHKGAFPPVE